MAVAYNKVMNTEYACSIELIDSYNNTLYLNSIIGGEQSTCVNWLCLNSENLINTWYYLTRIVYTYVSETYVNSLGNYWGINSTDTNNDGIANAPYVINADNVYYCPLMTPS